jgi:putative membrane protein
MERPDDNESRDELAQDRTDLAEDRTILAHERSFAGWVRTGMAAIGIGLAFNALFDALEPAWVPKAIATAFLLVAAYVFLSAERRARQMLRRLDAHAVSTIKPVGIRAVAWSLTILAIALAASIWLLI